MAVEQGGLQRFLRAGPLTWVLAAVCGWALLFWLGSMLGLGGRTGELQDAHVLGGQRGDLRIDLNLRVGDVGHGIYRQA